jgi:hypothetical protein
LSLGSSDQLSFFVIHIAAEKRVDHIRTLSETEKRTSHPSLDGRINDQWHPDVWQVRVKWKICLYLSTIAELSDCWLGRDDNARCAAGLGAAY